MVTHTIADVLYGIVRFRREKITTGEFLLKKTITVADGDLINIVEEYTSDNGTTSETIFHGRVNNVDYKKTQYVHAIDVADELNQVRPSGIYGGYTECVFGKIINDSSLVNVTCSQTDANITLTPNGDTGTQDWEDDTAGDGAGTNADDIDETIAAADGSAIYANGVSKESSFTLSNHSLSGNYHYHVYKVDIKARAKTSLGNPKFELSLYDGTDWLAADEQTISSTSYLTYTTTYTGLTLSEDDINDFKIKLETTSAGTEFVDTIDVIVYYYYYPNLTKCTEKGTYIFGGNYTAREILKVLNLVELKTWYIGPDFEIHFDGGDTATGSTIAATDKIGNVIGTRQVKSYDKVVLYGSYGSGGAQITSTRGAGDIIWRDNYLGIDDQTLLDSTADQILVEQGANTIRVQLRRVYATDGVYQVGETVEVGAGVKFSNSDRTIPIAVDATYIINKIDYFIGNGVYNSLDMELIDGLLFSTPKDDTMGVVKDGTIENSLGISQVAGGESAGQANTGSNIGTDGVGVYDSKSGVTLQFRNIAPASGKITVTENGDDIDIDVGDIDSVIEGIITTECGAGESIDNRIDALLTANADGYCTTAEAHDYVEANALTMTQDITFNAGQTFDGEDVSAMKTDLDNQCTTAEAIQAVEDTGLVLSATKVITSADADLDFIFGRCKVGSIAADTAYFSHRDKMAAATFALKQNASGYTQLNAQSATELSLRVGNVEKLGITATALTSGVPIAMSTNKITGLGNGVDAQDAMAFGQKYTDAEATTQADAKITAECAAGQTIDNRIDALLTANADGYCTEAEAHAYVEANALTLTADVNFNAGQTFDGEDVSAMKTDLDNQCTTAEAIQAVEDAGLTLSVNKTINIDGTPADATYTGIVLDIDTTGCATYDAVYVDGLNSVLPADATDISKMPAIGVVVAAGKVLVLGVVRNDAAWAITAANKVYVDDTTAGELVNTTAGLNTAGNIIQIMGVAVGNDMLYINPSLDWVEFV